MDVQSDRKKIIKEELDRLEREENVRILYACESGSRAWGFPSKDSDYDVRFLYIRPREWYLSIFDKKDVIERPISESLDISGWDLRKALKLFRKSNPPLLEWLQSPIRYSEYSSVAEQIRGMSPLAFSPKSCMHHYLNMARGNYRDYLQGDFVRLKKYFYVLRPVLACEWILRYGELPPMEFQTLVQRLVPDGSELKHAIQELLARKMAGEELDLAPRIHVINDYLDAGIKRLELAAEAAAPANGELDDRLDGLFRSALGEVWGK
ncbi:nucleotidyltransferase domain-containing protein [Paenibacillus sp. LHD-117]|nr:nucleotidyltransferase domain-containing protein [Paenibacillus sp. LHD-117]MDQ6422918.1 nucleotidyltransferase domain-containing protein [Paenibacillus sp. LHD-117]